MNQWRSALASGPRKMVPACSVVRANYDNMPCMIIFILGDNCQKIVK